MRGTEEFFFAVRPHAREKQMSAARAQLTLLGNFRLEDENGNEIRIASKKSRAVLAALALSEDGRRSRNWLQSLLWGGNKRSEGQANLRRELTTLRAALRDRDAEFLDISREWVALKLSTCGVDVRREGSKDMRRLLEGFYIPGEEAFETWLRDARNAAPPAPAARATRHCGEDGCLRKTNDDTSPSPDRRPVVAISVSVDPSANGVWPNYVSQALITSIVEAGWMRVVSADAGEDGADIALFVTASSDGESLSLAATARLTTFREALFAFSDVIATGRRFGSAIACDIDAFADQCAERIMFSAMLSGKISRDEHDSRKRLIAAVNDIFSLDRETFDRSFTQLQSIRDGFPEGVVDAWSAYHGARVHGFCDPNGERENGERVRGFMRSALHAEPYHPLVLSLCSIVQAFVFGELGGSEALLDRAEAIGARGVMFLDSKALLTFYAGRYEQAHALALAALERGRRLPYRYCFQTSLCMIEAMRGRLDEAIVHGYRALELEPIGGQTHYVPTLRYLGAALARKGETERARAVLRGVEAAGGRLEILPYRFDNPALLEFLRAGGAVARAD